MQPSRLSNKSNYYYQTQRQGRCCCNLADWPQTCWCQVPAPSHRLIPSPWPWPHRQTTGHPLPDNAHLITSDILLSTASDLIVPWPCTSRFYLLPKIHNKTALAESLVLPVPDPQKPSPDIFIPLCPHLVQSLPTYIWNTSQTLRQFNNCELLSPYYLIYPLDVQFVYISVPLQESLQALLIFLEHRSNQFPSNNILHRLVECLHP